MVSIPESSGGALSVGANPPDLEHERQLCNDVGVPIEATEEIFRLLVESVKEYAIFLLDPAGNIASWNVGAERIKGYRADEIIGQNTSSFYPEADVASGKPQRELLVALA